MSKELATTGNPHIESLGEEIKATFVERVFNAREEIILAHHETGKLLHTFVKKHDAKVTALVQYLEKIGCGNERTLWDCYRFFEVYPKLKDTDKLGHGKNLSWNKIKSSLNIDKPEKEKLSLTLKLDLAPIVKANYVASDIDSIAKLGAEMFKKAAHKSITDRLASLLNKES